MPVIKATTAVPDASLRQSLLTRLRTEIEGQVTDAGPVIFEIPGVGERMDILVVWEDWDELRSEDRTALILEAYGEQQKIAQALGVTYEEAMQQQLLPYTIVSVFEHKKFASLVYGNDQNEVKRVLDAIQAVKKANGGIILPNGTVDLRFPTRTMADNTLARLLATEKDREFQWRVVTEGETSGQ